MQRLGEAVDALELHHERPDGKGYPHGLQGTEIPVVARIVHVADAFDAMTSARPYRPALTVRIALSELRAGAGTQFDPHVAHHLAAVVERIEGRFRRTRRDRDPSAVPSLRSLPAG